MTEVNGTLYWIFFISMIYMIIVIAVLGIVGSTYAIKDNQLTIYKWTIPIQDPSTKSNIGVNILAGFSLLPAFVSLIFIVIPYLLFIISGGIIAFTLISNLIP